MSLTILFTGATSVAGRRFFSRLADRGHRVVPVSRRRVNGHETCIVDLCEEGAEKKLPNEQFDVLIHFASYVPTREADSRWDECAPMNV
ncbi:MAG: NAD-dependent epimerase/dehydratase family protein, partial [Alphaproteobacteria bacterium]